MRTRYVRAYPSSSDRSLTGDSAYHSPCRLPSRATGSCLHRVGLRRDRRRGRNLVGTFPASACNATPLVSCAVRDVESTVNVRQPLDMPRGLEPGDGVRTLT